MPAARTDASTPVSREIDRLTQSRDLWEMKYRMLMTRCRVLENQVRAVEASRDQWRQKFRDSQDQRKTNS